MNATSEAIVARDRISVLRRLEEASEIGVFEPGAGDQAQLYAAQIRRVTRSREVVATDAIAEDFASVDEVVAVDVEEQRYLKIFYFVGEQQAIAKQLRPDDPILDRRKHGQLNASPGCRQRRRSDIDRYCLGTDVDRCDSATRRTARRVFGVDDDCTTDRLPGTRIFA